MCGNTFTLKLYCFPKAMQRFKCFLFWFQISETISQGQGVFRQGRPGSGSHLVDDFDVCTQAWIQRKKKHSNKNIDCNVDSSNSSCTMLLLN